MAKIILGMTMSLDGFINDRDGSVERLYPELTALRENEALREAISATGAVVMGRRAYEMAEGDFTDYEFQTPILVLTHQVPETVAREENDWFTFHSVTDGIASAIARAKAAAGDKDVIIVGGASIARQALNAGMVDELEVAIRPILLGAGLCFFEELASTPVTLERLAVTESPTATDLRFRVTG